MARKQQPREAAGAGQQRAGFADAFDALRTILQPYASRPGFEHSERPGKYQLSSSTKTDRTGRPLFIASVEVKKNYVSYHLLPIYMNPALQAAVPPGLKKRMQGKACFNFTGVNPDQRRELAELTERGIASFKDVTLPWEGVPKRKR
jgi:hypothetical protein